MIRMMGLVDLKSVGVQTTHPESKINEDAPETAPDNIQGDTPNTPETDATHQSPKAQLMTLQTQTAELYNMVGEEEALEGWAGDNIKQAAELISAVHSHVNYEKKKNNTIGNGEGSPADSSPEMNEGKKK